MAEIGKKPVNPANMEPPEMSKIDVLIDDAYQDLSTCRIPSYNEMGQIPWTAIKDWSYEYGFDDLNALKVIIWRIDAHVRKLVKQKKTEAEKENDGQSDTGDRRPFRSGPRLATG